MSAIGTIRFHFSPSFNAGIMKDMHFRAWQHCYLFIYHYSLETNRTLRTLWNAFGCGLYHLR